MTGLTNCKNLPIQELATSYVIQLKMPLEYSNIRLLEKLFVRLHLEYSF